MHDQVGAWPAPATWNLEAAFLWVFSLAVSSFCLSAGGLPIALEPPLCMAASR